MKDTPVLRFVRDLWCAENLSGFLKLNPLLQDTVEIAIKSQMIFKKDDFKNLMTEFNGGYWFGQSSNGKYMGERFYLCAIKAKNKSAIYAYESFIGISPFLKDGSRVFTGCLLEKENRVFKVTGFNHLKEIALVSYLKKDSEIVRYTSCLQLNTGENASKKLHSFGRDEWLKMRSDFNLIK